MCGVGSEGVKMMNYVALSGIYQKSDVAYVFCELIINAPRL